MSQSEGAKAAGWGLAIIGLIQFIVFLLVGLFFLLFIPILLLTIGAILINDSLNGHKAAGWILAICGLVIFIVFIVFQIYFVLFIPIILLTIGAILIGATINEDKESATVQPKLSSIKTETKPNDGPISHDSEEYRRWKEGK